MGLQGICGDGGGMVDGGPVVFPEDGCDHNGHKAYHIQRECKQGSELFGCGSPDSGPFGEQGHKAHKKQGKEGSSQSREKGLGKSQPPQFIKGNKQRQKPADSRSTVAPEGEGQGLKAGIACSAAQEYASEQLSGIAQGNLDSSLGPPGSLPPGLTQLGGLLIIKNGIVAVADPNSLGHTADGEFRVLGEGEEIPASKRFQQAAGEAEAGAVDHAAGANEHAGTV